MSSAIVLIDKDLGYLYWLTLAVNSAGFEALPATNVPDAVGLVAALHATIGGVFLDCSLRGAPDFIANIRRSENCAKVISLVGSFQSPPLVQVDGICRKPVAADEQSKAELMRTVHDILLPDSRAN